MQFCCCHEIDLLCSKKKVASIVFGSSAQSQISGPTGVYVQRSSPLCHMILQTWIHESGKNSSGLPSSAIRRNSLAHGSLPFRAFVVRIIDSKSSSSKFISDLKAMSLYLRLLGGHVSLFATVAISEPPLEPRKLQVAEAATATGSSIHFPKFVLVQTISNSYSYIVSRCCLFYPFLFFSLRPLLWITLMVVHWPVQIFDVL